MSHPSKQTELESAMDCASLGAELCGLGGEQRLQAGQGGGVVPLHVGSGDDASQHQRINQFLDRIESTIKQSLRIATTQGKFAADDDVGAHANLLLCYVVGRWNQFGKSGFTRDPMAQWPQQWAILSCK